MGVLLNFFLYFSIVCSTGQTAICLPLLLLMLVTQTSFSDMSDTSLLMLIDKKKKEKHYLNVPVTNHW